MKLKVLFLMQLPPPVHGASVVNESIRQSKLINRAFECAYVDISPAKDMKDIGKLSFSKILSSFKLLYQSLLKFMQEKPDLVYITLSPHGFAFYKDALILMLIKALGGKVVVHLHGKGIQRIVANSVWKRMMYRQVFKKVSIIHLAKSLFKDVELVRDPDMPLIDVNNGTHEQKAVSAWTKSDTVPVFIYLSNLVPTKGADTLIEAINAIDIRYKNKFKVKFVGKISNQGFYDKLIGNLNDELREQVEFCGPLYGDAKFRALASSDVFILPTKNDCFPLAILEAMSLGLPVISTFEGAIPDIVDDQKNGFLFDGFDVQRLCELICCYIDNPHMLEQQGAESRMAYREKYTLQAFEHNFVAALQAMK